MKLSEYNQYVFSLFHTYTTNYGFDLRIQNPRKLIAVYTYNSMCSHEGASASCILQGWREGSTIINNPAEQTTLAGHQQSTPTRSHEVAWKGGGGDGARTKSSYPSQGFSKMNYKFLSNISEHK